MKKLLLITASIFMLSNASIKAQITFDHSYYIHHKDFYVIDIGNNEYKYVIIDSAGFNIYNIDHSPYLLNVIPPIPLWQPPSYYDVSYISKSLFDCDSTNIEYAITNWNNPANYYIYRTDGTLLFEKDSVTGYFALGNSDGTRYGKPIESTPNGTKLFLSDNKSTGQDSLYIYTLCGTLPASLNEVSISDNYVKVFPNPSNGVINFQINSPNNQEKFKLTIYNASFQKIDEATINGNNYQLDTKQKSLSSGIYLYDLRTKTKVYQTGKFIITK